MGGHIRSTDPSVPSIRMPRVQILQVLDSFNRAVAL